MSDSRKHGSQAEGITSKLEELNNLFDYLGKTHNLRGSNFTQLSYHYKTIVESIQFLCINVQSKFTNEIMN